MICLNKRSTLSPCLNERGLKKKEVTLN